MKNGYDDLAKEALEKLRDDVSRLLNGMKDGSVYDSSEINGSMNLHLLHAREALALARNTNQVEEIWSDYE